MSWVKVGPVCAHSELGHLILVQVKVGVHTASFCLKAAVLLQLSNTAATKTIWPSKKSAAEPVTCILCSFPDCDPQYLGSFSPLCSPISILGDRLCFQLGPLFNLTLIFNLQYLKELLLHVIFGSTSLVRCLLRCYREHIFYALLICVCTWLWCLLSLQE